MVWLDFLHNSLYNIKMINLNPVSGPNVQSSRPLESRETESRVPIRQSLATSMPSDRQTSLGIVQVGGNKGSSGEYEQWKKSKIFNPKQTSIAITAENYLKAKAGVEPIYMHNIAATKLALMSVMDKDKPRYSEQVNLLA